MQPHLYKGTVVNKSVFLKSALALALAAPLLASAESQLVVGTGNASAKLDFQVIIPRVLFLAVGSGAAGTALANNTNVDDVIFDYTTNPAAVGTGAVAGAITGNAVPVRVVGNNGVIALTATAVGALNNGSGDTIPWSEISATTSDANLPTPAILSGAGVPVPSNVATSTGTKITNRTATWTFGYANSTVIPAGSYGSTDGTKNGRVTYTATML